MRNVYQATSIRKTDHAGNLRTMQLEQLSYVFDCPCCEYVMTALTLEAIETVQHQHMVSLPSTHARALLDVRWDALLERVEVT